MSLRAHLAGLGARFDSAALRPPDEAREPDNTDSQRPEVAAAQAALQPALMAWCTDGAGPGGSPFWQPGGLPRVQLRYAEARLSGPDAATLQALAQAFARVIDGSTLLAARPGRIVGLALRLQVKLADALWWRRRRFDDPWDAGFLIDTPAAAGQIQQRFQPRRATLLIADGLTPQRLQMCRQALAGRSASLRHPLRLLVLQADGGTLRLQPVPSLL